VGRGLSLFHHSGRREHVRGYVKIGLLMLILTVAGYLVFIVPGVFLHLISILLGYDHVRRFNVESVKALKERRSVPDRIDPDDEEGAGKNLREEVFEEEFEREFGKGSDCGFLPPNLIRFFVIDKVLEKEGKDERAEIRRS